GVLGGGLDLGGRRDRLLRVLAVLGRRYVALLLHLLEHLVAPGQRRLRVRRRVVAARGRDDPGQHRRLPGVEVLRARAGQAAAARVVPAEVRLGGRLDPVGPVAEVDLVQVLREDLVLGPLALEVVGEGRLAELLEDRPAALRLEGVLHELLRDRRRSLAGRAGEDVRLHGAQDAQPVHAPVLVEALVLDRDRGLLHHRRDVLRRDQDAPLVVGQGRDLVVVEVVDDGVLRALVLRLVLELRQILGDGHHDPEDPGDEGEDREAQEHEGDAELSQPRPAARPASRGTHRRAGRAAARGLGGGAVSARRARLPLPLATLPPRAVVGRACTSRAERHRARRGPGGSGGAGGGAGTAGSCSPGAPAAALPPQGRRVSLALPSRDHDALTRAPRGCRGGAPGGAPGRAARRGTAAP